MDKVFCVHTASLSADTARTGLVEYAATLSAKQQDYSARRRFSHGDNTVVNSVFCSNIPSATLPIPPHWPDVYSAAIPSDRQADFFPQKEVVSHISEAARRRGAAPVLVAHFGVQTGMQMGLDTLEEFPVVAISHEFQILKEKAKQHRLQQLLLADQILFTALPERQAVLQAMAHHHGLECAQRIEAISHLYPVPAVIEPPDNLKNPEERARDMVVFGMIKDGKGLERIPGVAQRMRGDSYFSGKKNSRSRNRPA